MIKKALLASPLLLAALAACGNSGNSGTPSSSGGGGSTQGASSGAVLSVRSTSLGPVMVDSQGRTVYLLTADTPNHSSCNAACLNYWPPVKAPSSVPKSLPGITAKISSTQTMTGSRILTANGWPLYTYVGDAKPGDVKGEEIKNFGGTWYALSAAGNKVEPSQSGSSSTSGGGGY